MSVFFKMIVLCLVSPLLMFFIHAIFSRFSSKALPLRTAIVALAVNFVVCYCSLWSFILRPGAVLIEGWGATAVYFFIFYWGSACVYANFFNMSETARRIRILHEIKERGSVSQVELESFYKQEDVVDKRMQRLVEMEEVSFDGQSYAIEPGVLSRVASVVFAMRKLLGLDL